MSNVWFTSDTHFGHKNIIGYCNRPFEDAEEMTEVLIANWNERVKPQDTVYHLGDFAYTKKTSQINEIVRRLNGHKYLIFGNHDKKDVKRAEGFVWMGDYKRIRVNEKRIILFHYAMRTWHGSHRGSWQLYGHSHGSLPLDYKTMAIDVGVDVWDYAPISFEQVEEALGLHEFTPVDHHTEGMGNA